MEPKENQEDLKTWLRAKLPWTDTNLVRSISICLFVFAVLAIYKLVREIRLIQFYGIKDSFETLFSTISAILIPLLAGVLLWRSNKSGWIIGTAFFIYSLIADGAILLFKIINNEYFGFGYTLPDLPLLIVAAWALFWLFQKRIITFLNVNRETVLVITLLSLAYSLWVSIGLFEYMNSMI